MTVLSLLAVGCDLCGAFLTGFDASHAGVIPEQSYADPQDPRASVNVTFTGIATFASIPEAEDAAVAAGWERLDPADDHVITAMRCRTCARRASAMRAWIEMNRMITDAPEH